MDERETLSDEEMETTGPRSQTMPGDDADDTDVDADDADQDADADDPS